MKLEVKQYIVPSGALGKQVGTSERNKVKWETSERDDRSEGYGTMAQTVSDSMSQVITSPSNFLILLMCQRRGT